jgi:parallel beta-helix repeat protein
MDGSIPGRYTKHPFVDMIVMFIAIVIIATFLSVALKGNGGGEGATIIEDRDLKGEASGWAQTSEECNSCESCTRALAKSNIRKVTLTEDIYTDEEQCIVMDDIEDKTFDCEFKYIDGQESDGYLIKLIDSNRITVTNCLLGRKSLAINLFNSHDSKIIANTISYCGAGIAIASGENNQIIGNSIIASADTGIKIAGFSHNNNIEHNEVWNSGLNGIKMSNTRTVLINNKFCYSGEHDILNRDPESSNFGSGNFCDTTSGWTDLREDGTSTGGACTYSCR